MTTETHTSDMTARCLRQRKLSLQGLEIGQTATALFRGNAGHAALEALHTAFDPEQWLEDEVAHACVVRGMKEAMGKSVSEGRPITAAVERDQVKIETELVTLVSHYAARFSEYFAQCQLVGVELPVRRTIVVDGIDEDFASHVDLLFIGPDWWNEGSDFILRVWDWKFKEVSPTPDYITRHLQLGGYADAIRFGKFYKDGEWHEIQCGEVGVAIVDMMRCKPYLKSGKDFKKDDERPLNRIVHSRVIGERGMGRWRNEFADRVRMKRLDLWPMSPDPISCSNCDVRVHCEGYSE